MSKVERKEYHETKILKTRSPMRGTRGSAQDLAQFDNNLDYLLEDLQSSVARPPGTNTYRETRVTRDVDHGRSNSLNRVTHLKASNPVTEYSSDDSYSYLSPDGTKSVKSMKKESYYSSAGNNVVPEKIRMQNNINQLDSLLDDLKQVKQGSANNSVGLDPGLVETSKSRVTMGKKIVERELHYGDTPPRARTLDRSDREGSVTREIQYIDEGTYGETRPIRYTPSPSHSQASTLTKQKKVTNVHTYPMEVMETTTPDINPEILANLDPNLLPAGNTKVTTTIKTYTYEIPGSGYTTVSPDPEKYIYSPNQSQTTPSRSFVYNKVENNDVTNTVSYIPPSEQRTLKANIYKESTTTNQIIPPYQKPTPPPGAETTLIKETTTTRNYQPGYQVYPEAPPPSKQTFIYNETTTTKNIEDYPVDSLGRPIRPVSRDPPRNETYILKETHNNIINKSGPYPNGHPPQQDPGSTTVIYKTDTHSTNKYGSPPRRQTPPNTTVIINKTETNTTEKYDPNRYPDSPHSRRPNEPYDPNNVNITYKHTTHSTTSNKYGGGYPPEESQPLLRPQPFPSDGPDGPPKRVDELMAKIGHEPPDSPLNAGFQAHEAELYHQKKVDTLKHQQQATEVNDLQKKERNVPPTKNITGPPVYYPPGHELFAQKEESAAAWRAEGGMAKESGKYKYEAESGSKTKTRSGAAIVPVCLPLCCGIPCTLL